MTGRRLSRRGGAGETVYTDAAQRQQRLFQPNNKEDTFLSRAVGVMFVGCVLHAYFGIAKDDPDEVEIREMAVRDDPSLLELHKTY